MDSMELRSHLEVTTLRLYFLRKNLSYYKNLAGTCISPLFLAKFPQYDKQANRVLSEMMGTRKNN